MLIEPSQERQPKMSSDIAKRHPCLRTTAAAAEWLQSCPTLCDPCRRQPIPYINSCVSFLRTPWTVMCQVYLNKAGGGMTTFPGRLGHSPSRSPEDPAHPLPSWLSSCVLIYPLENLFCANSLVFRWLRLLASTAEGTGSIPGWGTKISHAHQCSQTKSTE